MTNVASEWDVVLDDTLDRTLRMARYVIPESSIRTTLELAASGYREKRTDVPEGLLRGARKAAADLSRDYLSDPVTGGMVQPDPSATPAELRQRVVYFWTSMALLRLTVLTFVDRIPDAELGALPGKDFVGASIRLALAAAQLAPELDNPDFEVPA